MKNDDLEFIYEKYSEEVFLYALSLCRNYHKAQDLTAETFFKALLSIDNKVYIKYWLFRVCRNLYLNSVKYMREIPSEEYTDKLTDGKDDPLYVITESEEKRELYRNILKLKENYREILILFYFWDMSLNDISKSMEITLTHAKTMLFRARKRLKEEMEGSE